MVWVIIILAVTILDQLSKYVIAKNIGYGEMISIIDKFFYLTHYRNKGAAWGILQNGRIFFICITLILTVAMAYYLNKTKDKALKISLSLVLGGAIGNFIDRLFRGSVVDFLEFHFGSYIFPTFNVADSFIVIGTFLLAYYILFIFKEEEKSTV